MAKRELKEFKPIPTAHRTLEYKEAKVDLRRPALGTENTMSISVYERKPGAPKFTADEVRDFITVLKEFLRE